MALLRRSNSPRRETPMPRASNCRWPPAMTQSSTQHWRPWRTVPPSTCEPILVPRTAQWRPQRAPTVIQWRPAARSRVSGRPLQICGTRAGTGRYWHKSRSGISRILYSGMPSTWTGRRQEGIKQSQYFNYWSIDTKKWQRNVGSFFFFFSSSLLSCSTETVHRPSRRRGNPLNNSLLWDPLELLSHSVDRKWWILFRFFFSFVNPMHIQSTRIVQTSSLYCTKNCNSCHSLINLFHDEQFIYSFFELFFTSHHFIYKNARSLSTLQRLLCNKSANYYSSKY